MTNKAKKIKGLPAFYGTAKGKVAYIKTIEDVAKIEKGDIVITDKITSEFTEAFMKAGAVVSARGGITCHAAIICREQEKPCIVACDTAFEIFKENQIVTIDTKALEYSIES